jgi:hypothetical protein
MLSLAATALEGTDVACGCETGVEPVVVVVTGVDVASPLQATSAIAKKIIIPAIDRCQLRFGLRNIFMLFGSPM